MELHKPTERVVSILNIVAKNPGQLTFSNISKLVDIPKSTLSPILKTLVELELLVLEPISQTYTVGLNAFQIGQTYLENINGLNLIKSHMRSIVNECNENCQVGINHNHEVLYLARIESSQPIKMMSSIGRNLPLYCTGLGRALLFEYSESTIKNLYSEGLSKFTENTVSNVDELLEIVKQGKNDGFCEEIGEVTSDAQCVAVPIISNGNIIAALGVSLPIIRASKEHIEKIKVLLKKHSDEISKELESSNITSLI